ncbi:tRNA pseudouridine(38-40) synthase TruA [Paenibacillus turpanensis]|uniref:tRNA pseudouridine(38-40) synthase TruA n=1 Tax=Paenibacillus turpanensis TaxID=2689078 RepID=UPI00140996F4|nr:tRNA pseudouridine(38-40) synthase TruA [Paenibacillus turpanensis]
MRNICMVVGYSGTPYNGFQTQPEGRTIQDEIQNALLKLTGETIKINGSGRTDAGVHAKAQVINFHTASKIPIERWCLALNSYLPQDIVFTDAREVNTEFNARKSAKRKTYRYTINANRYPDVFMRDYQFHHPRKLDLPAMRLAAEALLGEHDFTSFCSTRSVKDSHVRTLFEVRLDVEPGSIPDKPDHGQGIIHLYVTGSGFLYNMVRIIAGTLLEVGEGKLRSSDLTHILAAKDRSLSGPTAMPHGLMLWKVEYDFDGNQEI